MKGISIMKKYRTEDNGYQENAELRKDTDEYGNWLPERDKSGYMENATPWDKSDTWEDMGR